MDVDSTDRGGVGRDLHKSRQLISLTGLDYTIHFLMKPYDMKEQSSRTESERDTRRMTHFACHLQGDLELRGLISGTHIQVSWRSEDAGKASVY